MKLITIILALVLFQNHLYSQSLEQADIEGVWKGFVITDQQVPYEVVISSADGIYSGYSLTSFTVKGKNMIAVKKLKIERQGNELVMKDDELLFDNFQNKGAKEFEQTNTLSMYRDAASLQLNGKFVTKPTRQFRPMTGEIKLEKQPDTTSGVLIAGKLKELNLWTALSFLQPKLEVDYVRKTIPLSSESRIAVSRPNVNLNSILEPRLNSIAVAAPVFHTETSVAVNIPKPSAVVPQASAPNTDVVNSKAPVKTSPPVSSAVKPVVTSNPAAVAAKPAVKTVPPKTSVAKTTVPARTSPAVQPTATAGIRTNVPSPRPVTTPAPEVTAAYTRNLEKRKIETIQTLYFKTDSLVLTLYDNGEVDGDTVSLIMNGKMILSRQGLTTNPINKTIYITPDLGDSLQLIMYAENLGTLAPNTGLLIVYDGTERYEIRFSGDLQKNAAITFRRRKGS